MSIPLHPRGGVLFWLAGAFAMLVGPASWWAGRPSRDLTIPATLADRVNPMYAQQLRLLETAKAMIPPGTSYTAVATDLDTEMALFMFSLGVLRRHVPRPTSYFGMALPQEGLKGRYVISHRCEKVEPGALMILKIPEGCIYERPASLGRRNL